MTTIATEPASDPVAAPAREVGRPSPGDQWVVMPDVGWSGYSALLELRGGRRFPKLVYLDGDVWLMSPTFPHEHYTSRFGWFIHVLVEELDIPCVPTRALTLRRRKKKGGVEADESYYLAHAASIQGLPSHIDMATYPPPDLAIEVVISHPAKRALEVYRRLRVPEVWVYDGEELLIHILGPNGRYTIGPSLSFPFLKADEVHEWISRPRENNETRWVKDLRRWVAETLPARREG